MTKILHWISWEGQNQYLCWTNAFETDSNNILFQLKTQRKLVNIYGQNTSIPKQYKGLYQDKNKQKEHYDTM